MNDTHLQSAARTAISDALKAINILTGGSVVVILAFVSAIYYPNAGTALAVAKSVRIFALGAICGTLASIFLAASQYCYSVAMEKASSRLQSRGDLFRNMAIVAAALAFVAVPVGFYFAWFYGLAPVISKIPGITPWGFWD
ncbi:hypothetical protein LB526_01990 [Mesorhizobium sp. CA6]|uniref:hypothetical protein n=1 Tax=Mesorhizobium sp. CA6 TaxID=588500 RepID=UPI001CCEBD2D|nr:hypothetical protein [Mesorhizobium sp. CA6]MBZ9765531.1 hypothetical protein [Mesorhizobium sp. CA6]